MLKVNKIFSAIAVCLSSVVFLSACGSDYPLGEGGNTEAGNLSGILSGSGSSAQKSVMDAWRSGFSKIQSKVHVQYSPDGSGAGRSALLSGAVQFAGSDAYLRDDALEESKKRCGPEGALDIPVYVSPLVVFFNLSGISELNLRPATVAKIFRGELKYWDDPEIETDNQGTDLPHAVINSVHRNDSSGTTQNFTEYLAAAAPGVWTDVPAQSWPENVGGESAKGTSGVVTTALMNEGSVSYADGAEVPEQLGRGRLLVGQRFVAASPRGASNAVSASRPLNDRNVHDRVIVLDRATADPETYPLAFVSYHVICSGYPEQKIVDLVKGFESYVVSAEGQKEVSEAARSVPLPDAVARQAQEAIDSVKVLP